MYLTMSDMNENVGKIAMDIAGKPRLSVFGTKDIMLNSRDLSVADGLDYVAGWIAAFFLSTDFKKAFTAKMEKREPLFSKL